MNTSKVEKYKVSHFFAGISCIPPAVVEKSFWTPLKILLVPNYCDSIFVGYLVFCVARGLAAAETHREVEIILLFIVNKAKLKSGLNSCTTSSKGRHYVETPGCDRDATAHLQHVAECWQLDTDCRCRAPQMQNAQKEKFPTTVFSR